MLDRRANSTAPVLAIGEILIDFIVDDGATSLASARTFVARAGGAPANVTVALARLGVPSAFCGVVGADPFGTRLVEELQREGVDTSRLRQSQEASTTLAYAWKDSRGDGHFWLLRDADLLLSAEDASNAGIGSLGALVIGSVALADPRPRAAIEFAISLAVQHGVHVIFDVNWRPTVWSDHAMAREICESTARASRLVKLSLDDARGLLGLSVMPEAAVEHFLSLGPRAVILTDGARGCWFSTASGQVAFVPSFSVEAVEPTGAGDAFLAALIASAIARDWAQPDGETIRYAAAAGALATTRPGAWDGLPTTADLESFLATA